MRNRLLEKTRTPGSRTTEAFLALFPPDYECEIVENTSWSCAHGIERWRSDCGCNGGRARWNQQWRAPLRAALDQLRDALVPLTVREGAKLFHDVWAARDGYIQVILDRTQENVAQFLRAYQSHPAQATMSAHRLSKLMEMQRHAQLMYTSCGWFFDDISGIETVQVIAYAAARFAAGSSTVRRAGGCAGACFPGTVGTCQVQRTGGGRWRSDLSQMRCEQGTASRTGGRSLRHQLGIHPVP